MPASLHVRGKAALEADESGRSKGVVGTAYDYNLKLYI
jgi:hypothetical protein